MLNKLIIAPTEEPVSLAEAKASCSEDSADFDALFEGWIAAARSLAEHKTGRALCTQTRELVLDAFPSACILRHAPVQSLVSVKYLDLDGIEQTLDPQDTLLDKDSEPGYLLPAYGKGWPATYPVPNAVRVRYVCGYGAAGDVPHGIKAWMQLVIGTFYEQRASLVFGQVAALPDRFCDSNIDPYVIFEAC